MLIINLSLPALLFSARPVILNRLQCSRREAILQSASRPLPPPYLQPLHAPHWLGIYLNMRRPACCFWQRGLGAETPSSPLPPLPPPPPFCPSTPPPSSIHSSQLHLSLLRHPGLLTLHQPLLLVNLNHRPVVKGHYRQAHCACAWLCVCLSARVHTHNVPTLAEINNCVSRGYFQASGVAKTFLPKTQLSEYFLSLNAPFRGWSCFLPSSSFTFLLRPFGPSEKRLKPQG